MQLLCRISDFQKRDTHTPAHYRVFFFRGGGNKPRPEKTLKQPKKQPTWPSRHNCRGSLIIFQKLDGHLEEKTEWNTSVVVRGSTADIVTAAMVALCLLLLFWRPTLVCKWVWLCVHTRDACVQRRGTTALAEPAVTVSTVLPGCIANAGVSYLSKRSSVSWLQQLITLLWLPVMDPHL